MTDPPAYRHTLNNDLSPEAYHYLLDFRQRFAAEDVIRLLEAASGRRVLVVGEAIIDEYDYVEPMGKSAKDAVLAARHLSAEAQAGGALAVANHVAAFAGHVDLLTAVGDRDRRETFIREHLRPSVRPTFVTKASSPTIVKRRIVDHYSGAKLLEVYDINDTPLAGADQDTFCTALGELMPQADVVIVADFGHGLLTDRAVAMLQQGARFLALNVQTNAANLGFHTVSRYPRADFVSIQEREVRLDRRDRQGALDLLVREMNTVLGARTSLVTRGKFGSLLYGPDGTFECPSLATRVVDRLGAGDAVFAIAALCVTAGMASEAVNFVANAVGALAVTVVGNRSPVDRHELEEYVRLLLTEVGE